MNGSTNVASVQKVYDLFGHGDIAGILALFAEDVVWHEPSHSDIPYGGKRQGKSAIKDFFAAVGQIEVSEFLPHEYLPSGDRVVALGHWAGKVRSTGKSFRSDWAMVWTFANGLVTSFAAYEDTAAVAAAFQK